MKQYDVAILRRDINPVIKKGMRGVILEVLEKGTYIAEFVKEDGRNYEYNGEGTFILTDDDFDQ